MEEPPKKKYKKGENIEPVCQGKYHCDQYGKRNRSKKGLNKHMARQTISMKIPSSKISTEKIAAKGSDKSVLPSGQKLQYEECQRYYSNAFILKRHLETIHGRGKTSLPNVPNTRKSCRWCGRYCLVKTFNLMLLIFYFKDPLQLWPST